MKNLSRREFTKISIATTFAVPNMILPQTLIMENQSFKKIQLAQVKKDDWMHPWNNKIDSTAEGISGDYNHGNLFIRYNNLPLLNYRVYQTLKYPYFSPLIGPKSGLSLISESSLPYPHHRGIWLGCEPMDGGDYWGPTPLSMGQIQSTKLDIEYLGKESIRFINFCKWIRDDSDSPLEDQRTFELFILNDHVRLLDCEFKIRPLKDISIVRAKHAFFAIRCAPDIAPTYGGTLINSKGDVGAEGTYGQPARWCTYFGPRAMRPEIVEGIAVLDHPDNFWGSSLWFTRDYGHLSPQSFNFLKEPVRLVKGENFVLKYRIVLYAGSPNEIDLDALYEQWI